MLYICIPAYNEGPTIGVLLWRIRKVLQDYSRPFEIIVFDDGSTDSTREILQPYEKVLPLSVVGGKSRMGYVHAVTALVREVAGRTRYPRRDAAIFMQGDFTDQPEHVPELVKRFEGGADVVVAQRTLDKLDKSGRTLARWARWVMKPFVSIPDIEDPFGTFRLYRISVLRELLKAEGEKVLEADDSWGANLELLLKSMKLARRTESVIIEPRYDVRMRPSRLSPLKDALRLFRFGWIAKKWQPQPART